MPFMKSILGLDTGSHTIKAFEVLLNMRGPQSGRARAHAISGLVDNAGDGTNTDEHPEDLGEALQRFVNIEKLQTDQVISSIPGDQVSLRRLEFPFKDKKKLTAAVPFAVEGEVPFELDDVVIDWTMMPRSTHPAGHCEVLAALTRKTEVERVLSTFEDAGIVPRTLEAEGMVLGNLTSVFELSGNRLLVDLGHKNTTLCLVVDGHAITARTVPVAGLAITKAVAEAHGCSLDEAERIKCTDGAVDAHGEMLPKAKAVISRICREIVRMIESSQGDIASRATANEDGEVESPEVSELTVMGGTSKLRGITEAISEQVGVGVRPLGDPIDGDFAVLITGVAENQTEDEVNEHFEEIDVALYAHAIALAVRGSAPPITRIDFRQNEFAYRTNFLQIISEDIRPTLILAAVAAGFALLSFGVSLALESSRASTLENRTRALYSEVIPGENPESPVPALGNALRNAQDRADFLGIYGTDLSAVDLLTELSQRIPKDVQVQFDDLNIDRRVVKIKVVGDSYQSADRLKGLLTKSPPFGNAEVAKVKSRGEGKTFDLTLNLSAEGDSL
jgi:general secretion pathway protein L